jgi:hypothetical protein
MGQDPLETGLAEGAILEVQLLWEPGGFHETPGSRTVDEAEGMSHFVQNLLEETLLQKGRSILLRSRLGPKPIGGDHTGRTAQLGITEKMGKNGQKEVHVGQADPLHMLMRWGVNEHLEEAGDIVLLPHRIKGGRGFQYGVDHPDREWLSRNHLNTKVLGQRRG